MKKGETVFYFDLIRVLSTILIVCCHFSACFTQFNIDGFDNFLLNFANTDSGKIGVYLFFMLSGATLIYNYEDDSFMSIKFYGKRYLKIFPMFYISWLLFYLIKAWKLGELLYNGSIIRMFWTLIGMDYYLGGAVSTYAVVGEWFTGAIIILYVLFPILRKLYKNKYGYYITSILLYVLWLINWFIKLLPNAPNIESIFVDIFYFWLGMMFVKEKVIIDKISVEYLVIVLIPLILVKNQFSVLANSLIISIIIYILCTRCNGLETVLKDNVIFKFICKYSYAIYLVHHQVIYIVMERYTNLYLPVWKSVIIYGFIWCCISFVSKIVYELTNLMINMLKKQKKRFINLDIFH